jgi:putative transposase
MDRPAETFYHNLDPVRPEMTRRFGEKSVQLWSQAAEDPLPLLFLAMPAPITDHYKGTQDDHHRSQTDLQWTDPTDVIQELVERSIILGQKEGLMGRQRHTAEQIIGKLREGEVQTGKGIPLEEVLRQLGISDATYCKWRKEYRGLRVDQARRLRELEQDNSKLRKVIADLTSDNAILKEAARGNG